jgi:hypothetical protein
MIFKQVDLVTSEELQINSGEGSTLQAESAYCKVCDFSAFAELDFIVCFLKIGRFGYMLSS